MEQKGAVASLEFKGKDGNPGMKSVASEKGVPLPENFPKDVPLFKDALVTLATTMGDMLQVKTLDHSHGSNSTLMACLVRSSSTPSA